MNSDGNDWRIDDVISETFIASVETHDELASTNDRALDLAADSESVLPRLILAHRQTQGRGRAGNLWWSANGSLTFSLLLAPDSDRLPRACWPQISLTIGTSICVALDRQFPGADVRLKWPNDVFLNGRKVCGILVEIPPIPGRMVVGVGLNVNNSMLEAPTEIQDRATALSDVFGPQPAMPILLQILKELEFQLDQLWSDPLTVRALWRNYDLLIGRNLTIADGLTALSGTCQGLADDGGLLLQTDAGLQHCYAGVVESFS